MPMITIEAAQNKIDNKTKPVGSLGLLEETAIQLALVQNTLQPCVAKKRMLVYAASHGIAEEGVSAFPAAVTGQMVENFLHGGAAINILCRHGGIEVHVIDVGVDVDFGSTVKFNPVFFDRRVRRGTRNFAKEAAMTEDECQQAMDAGREQVRLARENGVQMLGIGEMGIANTTSAAAIYAALLGIPPEKVAGRGTGVSDEGLQKKQQVIKNALISHHPTHTEPLALYWLSAVGGFEIAAMAGTILEAAHMRVPVVVDGFIATAAAAVAMALDEKVKPVCFFAHCSNEQAHAEALECLQARPLLNLEMRLGEGTGAALAMHLIDSAAKIMCDMATFESAGVSNQNQS